MRQIKVVAFDADDTLWVNEPYFRDSEAKFAHILSNFLPIRDVEKVLFDIEINNLPIYGYGVKAFTISMIEAAIQITEGNISAHHISQIINIGKEQLAKPIEILPGIEEVLSALQGHYRLVMATKGDLLEQQSKLDRSGLAHFFHHTEIISEKTKSEYEKLIAHLDIEPEEFLMVGNSLKSDILPVLECGAQAVHIPFHTTWAHEVVTGEIEHPLFQQLENASQLIAYLIN